MEFKVIVTINETNAAQYNALFAKAYQALAAEGKIKEGTENSEGRFSSLNHYLAHAKELFQIDPAYLLIPLDEPAFNINANNRTITASKIVILQNDNLAETVQFTVDRYFDHMDLNEARIFVQWTLPDGTEGATWADDMKDLSTPGKIRFGWPLTTDVTSQPGTVKFSVRFWNKGLDETDGKEKVTYSFNTLTSSLTISPSLQPIVNNDQFVVAPKGSGLFEKAIFNSQIATEGYPLPLSPHFGTPGLNLPKTATLIDNQLVLKAQAVVGDTGTINYKWYYTPAVDTVLEIDGNEVIYSSEISYPYEDVLNEEGEVVLYGFKHFNGIVNDRAYEEYDYKTTGKLNFGDVYYTKNGDDYNIYPSTVVPDSGELYERYTTYTIPEGSDMVTGIYNVKATNTISVNTSRPQPSNSCTLIGPDDIVFTKNLPTSKITSGESVDFEVGVKPQTNDNAVVKYKWKRSTSSSSEGYVEEDETGLSCTVLAPGWCQMSVEATLNRETKTLNSEVCKLTFAPTAPVLSYGTMVGGEFKDNGLFEFEFSSGVEEFELIAKTNIEKGEAYQDQDYSPELFSDYISYRWTVQKPDGVAKEVLINGESVNSPTLTVKNNLDEKDIIYTYKCYATNHLSGASTESSDGLAFSIRQ